MKLVYILLFTFCCYIVNSYERITSQKITKTICEDTNYKIYCSNSTLIVAKNVENETHYTIKNNGDWEKIYVKQCTHEITKNGKTTEECLPCYFNTYQDVCKRKHFNVYCNVKNYEKKYCKKIEYIV
ncbi:hypothetical protein BCR36DRAFT_413583 [Piromyces finnis]|uniref:Uncharacterized protein n=1 Tax=Piromyces finnis TaxID=1754191 RepID=A0A1Y1V6E6_9FUNG|nr:hypothetical protein BCR36DRAFT_413583 [Piromyces finnis]|eukprot:ORX47639.1 hypothetical protein BCR36DRAFT_413583 [Piromyces finnis]